MGTKSIGKLKERPPPYPYTTGELNDMLFLDLACFAQDPLGHVMFSYPWGQPGELQNEHGPRTWQRELLESIGEQLRSGAKDKGEVIQEAIASGHGIGKAHPLTATVETPTGLRKWGDIHPGDVLFGADGRPATVIARRDYADAPLVRVTFDDGSSVACSTGHLWRVKGRNERRTGSDWRTVETAELMRGVTRANGRARARQWEIPQQGAAQFPVAEVPIHPYVLGLWLGDGGRNAGRITSNDPEVAARLTALGLTTHAGTKQGTTALAIGINGLKVQLRAMGLLARYSYEKSVPPAYLRNDERTRAEILRGLLDTDGEANAAGSVIFSSTSEQLALDVVWLARSLGGKASMQPTVKRPTYKIRGKKKNGRPCWRATLTMPPGFIAFYVQRKQARLRKVQPRYLTRWIAKIEPVPTEPAMCVETVGGLYQIGDFTVTHNSALVSWLIKWAMDTAVDTRIVVTAGKGDQLRTKTWPELGKWHRQSMTAEMFVFTATSLYSKDPEHEKNWRCDAETWSEHNTDTFAGLHNKGKRLVLIFDEAMAVADKVWDVAEGALTDENTEIIWAAFGNPTGNTGRFKDCFGKNRIRWSRGKPKQIDSRTVEGTNKVYIAKLLADHGEDSDYFKVRVRGMFPNISMRQYISTEDVDKAYGRHLTPGQFNFAPKILTLDNAWCFDDQTEILTFDGFKLFKDLTGAEYVYSLDGDIGKWMPITKLHKYEFKGQLNQLSGRRGVDFCITDDHRLLARRAGPGAQWGLRTLNVLPSEFHVRRVSGWAGASPKNITFKKRWKAAHGSKQRRAWTFGMADWAAFLGWFVSEGCAMTPAGKSDTVVIEISQKPGAKAEAIRALLERMKLPATYRGHSFVISNTAIGRHLLKHCGKYARNKRIPKYIKEGSAGIIDAFLATFAEGDGCQTRGGCTYYTTSRLLADDIQECLAKVGRCGKLTRRHEPGSQFVIDGRTATRKSPGYTVWGNKTASDGIVRKVQIKRVDYEGHVYCVSTPLQTIFVRRNGVCMWSGNSGEDEVVIGLRQGLMFKVMRTMAKNDNDMVVGQLLANLEDEEGADAVFIDGGFGTGVASYGKTMQRNWQLVWFAEKSADPGCINKRAEMWKGTRDWLKAGGAIPEDTVLHADLIGPEVVPRNDGKLQLESKEDMRARLLPSPGRGDALALSFAHPVAKRDPNEGVRGRRGRTPPQHHDYDPYTERK